MMGTGNSQFGSDLDSATQHLLNRGSKLTELLKQNQFSPLTIEQQVCVLFCGVKGFLDKLNLNQINRFEIEFLASLDNKGSFLLQTIRDEKLISKETETKLREFIESFLISFK